MGSEAILLDGESFIQVQKKAPKIAKLRKGERPALAGWYSERASLMFLSSSKRQRISGISKSAMRLASSLHQPANTGRAPSLACCNSQQLR